MRVRPVAILAIVLGLGCEGIAGLDEFADADGTTSATASGSGTGGATSSTGSAGAGGAGTGTAPPTGGAGGGGTVPQLVDDGLVLRYFLDEAASGTTPTVALDSAPSSFDLAISYGPVSTMTYTEVQGNRGLNWDAINTRGFASSQASSDGKIVTELQDSTAATIEVVVRVQAFQVVNNFFFNLRNAASARLAFGNDGSGSNGLFLEWNGGARIANWAVDITEITDRVVLHAVLDSTQATEGDRVALYVDGALQANGPTGAVVALNASFDFAGATGGLDLALGNWADGQPYSFNGTLFYVALYSEAFTPEQIAQNNALLAVSDDGS